MDRWIMAEDLGLPEELGWLSLDWEVMREPPLVGCYVLSVTTEAGEDVLEDVDPRIIEDLEQRAKEKSRNLLSPFPSRWRWPEEE